eukprot:gene934-5201_t
MWCVIGSIVSSFINKVLKHIINEQRPEATWLRVALRYHSLPQVLVGYTMGAATAVSWCHLGRMYLIPILDTQPMYEQMLVTTTIIACALFGHRYMTSVVLMARNPGRRNRLPTGGICPRASALSAADDAIQAAVLEAKSCQVAVDEIRASLSSTDLFTCDKGQRESLIAAQAAEIPGDVESSGESEDGSPAPSKSGTGVSTQALSDGTMGPVTALMGQVSTVAAPPDVPKVVSKSPDLAFLLAAEEKLHEAEIEVAILRSEKGQIAIELQRSKHALRLSKIQLRDLDDLRAAHL